MHLKYHKAHHDIDNDFGKIFNNINSMGKSFDFSGGNTSFGTGLRVKGQQRILHSFKPVEDFDTLGDVVIFGVWFWTWLIVQIKRHHFNR